MPDPNAIGRRCEEVAAAFLRRRGYRIHETNFRCSIGELDIVASERDVLVFVEVRARSGGIYGTPAESVTLRKQQKLRQVADAYLQLHYGGIPPMRQNKRPSLAADKKASTPPIPSRRLGEAPPCRIDVVVISLGPNGSPKDVELIRDAVSG